MATGGYFQQTQRKRLVLRPYLNPYFRREPKPNRSWLFLIVAFLFFAGACWFFLAGPWFDIQKVAIDGAETLAPQALEARAWEHLRQKRFLFFENRNRFLFRPERLKTFLEGSYLFESLSLGLEEKTVRVRIREKQSELVWMTPDKTSIIDREGVVLRILASEEREAREKGNDLFARLLQCRSAQKEPLAIGMSVLSPAEVEHLFFFRREWELMGIQIKEIKIDRAAGAWMAAKTVGGFEILFDPAVAPEEQMTNFSAVFRQEIKDPSALQYIDIRFGNHVYYK